MFLQVVPTEFFLHLMAPKQCMLEVASLMSQYVSPTRYLLYVSERGREGRLARLVLDTSNRPNGTPYGLGIDEDTALVVTNVGQQSETGEVSTGRRETNTALIYTSYCCCKEIFCS